MNIENNSYMAEIEAKELDINEFIIESTGAIVYVIDLETLEILYANAMCKKEFGDVIGGVCFKVLQDGKDEICGFCPMQENTDGLKIGDSFEWENTNSINGKTYGFNDRVIVWNNGRLAKIHVGIDVTEQKRLKEELLLKKDEIVKSFETLTDTTIEGLIVFNEHKECIRVNRVAPELFGYASDEMIGRHAFDFVAQESRDFVSRVIKIHDQEPYEAMMLRKDGSKFPAILRGRDLDLDGRRIRVSAVMDITTIKEKEQRIMELAKYDSLTSLPNRMT
ncbi:MAG TPA: PAS domain S-box protein, partial [Campylobacterales bacterium]|nr:PAS domain S-box protein [Campylobacterales bacterium]